MPDLIFEILGTILFCDFKSIRSGQRETELDHLNFNFEASWDNFLGIRDCRECHKWPKSAEKFLEPDCLC